VIVLSLGTAFFVAGEFALVAADRTKVEHLAEQGDRGAISTLKALKTLSFQLSGAQLGITVTSLLVGFIVRPTLGAALIPLAETVGLPQDAVEGTSVVVALLLATAVQMVIGELIPKNIAVAEPLKTSSLLATPFRLVNAALRPLIVALNAAANATVRLFGIEPRDELESIVSLEELETLIQSSRRSGLLPEEDFSLLSRSITFAGKTAADALVPRTRVVGIQRDETVLELAALAVETGHTRFPVFAQDIDQIEGVVNIKSIFDLAPDDRSRTKVSSLASDAPMVPESRPLDLLLTQMRRERAHMVVVLDEYGGTAGILTLEDVLEEIVGDIEDEHDRSAPVATTAVPEGVFILDGLWHPDEVENACGFTMPEGDFETLGGFLMDSFGRIPGPGDQIAHDRWEFKVKQMDGRRIAEVLAVRPSDEDRS
jgi:CBS domain containing-hemolysin-like protein